MKEKLSLFLTMSGNTDLITTALIILTQLLNHPVLVVIGLLLFASIPNTDATLEHKLLFLKLLKILKRLKLLFL